MTRFYAVALYGLLAVVSALIIVPAVLNPTIVNVFGAALYVGYVCGRLENRRAEWWQRGQAIPSESTKAPASTPFVEVCARARGRESRSSASRV